MAWTKHTPKTHTNDRLYSVKLVTNNGNLVGYINLAGSFIRAVLGKEMETTTAGDILSINHGDFEAYINNLNVVVEETTPSTTTPLEQY